MSQERFRELNRAFEEALSTYGDRVYRLALRMTGVPASAEDITQEVFLKFWSGLPSFPNPDSPWGWLKMTTRNACIDLFRKHKTARDKSESLRGSEAQPTRVDPERNCSDRERALQTLASLPNDLRSVLMLKYVEGHSGREVAQILGRSESWVSTRSTRLREQLEARGWRLYNDDE